MKEMDEREVAIASLRIDQAISVLAGHEENWIPMQPQAVETVMRRLEEAKKALLRTSERDS